MPPSLDELEKFLSQTIEEENDLDSPQEPENTSEQIEPAEVSEHATESLAEKAASNQTQRKFLSTTSCPRHRS